MVTRRALLFGLGGVVVASGAVAYAVAIADPVEHVVMTPPDLLDAVRRGEVLLVDIRRPDEWQATGLAEGAVPIDLRRPDFIDAVLAARGQETQPIVLICARGVRSRRLSARLTETGLGPIIDVPEGMLGSISGPGWLKRELPVRAWTG